MVWICTRVFCASLGLCLFAGCSEPPPVEIHSVVFHEICPHTYKGPCASPDYFRDVISMLQLVDANYLLASEAVAALDSGKMPNGHSVMLSFDDAEPGVVDYAHPILEEFDARATYFVFTQGVNEGRPRCLGWDDVHALHESGRWEIQSHGHAHLYYPDEPPDAIDHDMSTAIKYFRHNGYEHPLLIAYPFGLENTVIRTLAKHYEHGAGFIAGPQGIMKPEHDRFALPRTTIAQVYPQELVCRKLGLDVSHIRERIMILDEAEGTFSGEWERIKVGVDEPTGQYGRGYTVARADDATWSVTVTLKHRGMYRMSFWFPDTKHRDENSSLSVPGNIRVRLDSPGGMAEQSTVSFSAPSPNRWNAGEHSVFELMSGTHTFTVDATETMLMDAMKLEWLSEVDWR